MTVEFPSVGFFRGLQEEMRAQSERFRRLGFIDTTFGIRILGEPERCFVLAFEVFECAEVREVKTLAGESLDFVLEGKLEAWREMFENVRAHGQADAEHGINTLTHFGEKIRVVYDDPDGHDKLYRFVESIQEFFDLAAQLEWPEARERRAATA
ncbi:MAG: hypothetical protein ACREQ9_18290 [Candidatus Binatia bacterium]